MATRGRKPLTNEQKQLRGETRPSRTSDTVVEFPKAAEVPKPPAWVKHRDGKKLWNELAPLLFQQRVLATVDVHALGHLCQLHGKIVDDYRRKVQPTAAELSQLRMYFSEFGLTPSSRTRVGTTGGGGEGNRFSRNGRKAKASTD